MISPLPSAMAKSKITSAPDEAAGGSRRRVRETADFEPFETAKKNSPSVSPTAILPTQLAARPPARSNASADGAASADGDAAAAAAPLATAALAESAGEPQLGGGYGGGAELPPLPLEQRGVDKWLLAWYGIFLFTVLWTDLHNFSASLRTAVGYQEPGHQGPWLVKDLEEFVMGKRQGSLGFPPRFLSYYYFRWARTADPLLFQNPIWWQCIEWVNLLCLMPFAAWALHCFWHGANAVRLPAIIVSSFTFYSLILCIGSSLFGDEAAGELVSKQKAIFFFIYVPYLIFPAIVVARLWREQPFSRPLPAALDAALRALSALVFLSFAAAGVVWYFTCESQATAALPDPRCSQS